MYPSDALSGDETLSGSGDGFFSSERLVAHWSAPIELCLVARRAPAPREYPVIFFQVSSYDAWDRYRPEGYGALSLRPHDQTGARAREVRTWRAGGTIRDRIATHYVGGAPEIGNLSYVAAPAFGAERDAGSQKVHSRLGFVADASGTIAVRAHTMTQRPKALSAGARKGISALRGVLTKGKGLGFGGPGARDQTSLGGGEALDVDDDAENAAPGNGSARGDSDQTEDVVARARARIAEARAQGRLDPDVSARATLIARGAGAPQAPGAGAGAGAARVVDFDFVARRNRRVDALGDDAALERRVMTDFFFREKKSPGIARAKGEGFFLHGYLTYL